VCVREKIWREEEERNLIKYLKEGGEEEFNQKICRGKPRESPVFFSTVTSDSPRGFQPKAPLERGNLPCVGEAVRTV